MDIFSDSSLLILLILALPIVAFLYAAVGHGGASGYLALMSICSVPITLMKPSALILNILVSSISFYFYWRANHFKWKLFYPFAITSVPASFVGGLLDIEPELYKLILGCLLIIAVIRLLVFIGKADNSKLKEVNLVIALVSGALIGFLSGMIGIGGGIILSPLILLLRWGTIKETAAVSALFIFVNSIAGLAGLATSGVTISSIALYIALLAVLGGIAGAYYGSSRLDSKILRQILAFVLLIASLKLIFV